MPGLVIKFSEPWRKDMLEPLYMSVDQTLNGDHALIVQTLDALADALEAEVRSRKREAKSSGQPVDASHFLQILSAESTRLAGMFAEAGPAFQRAVAPSGSPQMYVGAYGSILADLSDTTAAVGSVIPPRAFERTGEAYRCVLRTVYNQIAAWPEKLRQSAKQVHGDTCHVQLEVNVEMTPYERAFEADRAALGI